MANNFPESCPGIQLPWEVNFLLLCKQTKSPRPMRYPGTLANKLNPLLFIKVAMNILDSWFLGLRKDLVLHLKKDNWVTGYLSPACSSRKEIWDRPIKLRWSLLERNIKPSFHSHTAHTPHQAATLEWGNLCRGEKQTHHSEESFEFPSNTKPV